MNTNSQRLVLSAGLSLLSLGGLLAEPLRKLISWKASLPEPYRDLPEIEAGKEVLVPIVASTNEASLVFRAAPRTAYSFAAKSASDLALQVARILGENSGIALLGSDDDSGGGHDPKIASVCFDEGSAVHISLIRAAQGGAMSLTTAARLNVPAVSGMVLVQAIAGDCVAAAAAAKADAEKRQSEDQQRLAAEAASRLAAQMAAAAAVPDDGRFESPGLDSSKWAIWREAASRTSPFVDTARGNPGSSLNGGDTCGHECGNVLYRLADVNYQSGVTITFDFWQAAENNHYSDAMVGLAANRGDAGPQVLLQFQANNGGGLRNLIATVNQTSNTVGKYSSAAWHTARIVVPPTRLAQFYLDGTLLYTSPAPVEDIGRPATLFVLGRSYGGATNIDNVSVLPSY